MLAVEFTDDADVHGNGWHGVDCLKLGRLFELVLALRAFVALLCPEKSTKGGTLETATRLSTEGSPHQSC